MIDEKDAHLDAILNRLGETLLKAERRCMRYSETGSAEHDIDVAFVEHLAVALYQLQKYQHVVARDKYSHTVRRDNMGIYIKDAIIQLHELSKYIGKKEGAIKTPFMKRLIDQEERWIRMNNIALVGYMIHSCTDNIRISLKNLQRNLDKMKPELPPGRQFKHLRLVHTD